MKHSRELCIIKLTKGKKRRFHIATDPAEAMELLELSVKNGWKRANMDHLQRAVDGGYKLIAQVRMTRDPQRQAP